MGLFLTMSGGLNLSDQIAELTTLAVGLFERGNLDEAENLLSAIHGLSPDDFTAIKYLGVVAASRGRYGAAIQHLYAATALKDDDAFVHNVLSVCHFRMGDLQSALDCADRALALARAYQEAHNNRGNALNGLGRHEEALAAFRMSLVVNPGDPAVMVNIANALRALDRSSEALEFVDRAIRIDPAIPDAHYNRGNILQDLGRHAEAIRSYDRALALSPDDVLCHLNRCYCNLLTGNLMEGWREQEWRPLKPGAGPPRGFPMPLWLGQADLRGKSILLHCEQGFGDCLQFVRYAPVLARRGASVLIEAYPPLERLFRAVEGVTDVVARGAPLPVTDFHCPLMSLPLALEEAAVSVSRPYLHVPQEQVEDWRGRFGNTGKPRVGIASSGRATHKNDMNRSIGLECLARHLPAGPDYFLLQKDLRDEDAWALEARRDFTFVGDAVEDFMDTAAICMSLDLVISVDTSIAHLAGALGRPTWILLPFDPDWRWFLGTDQSPWYPSARLYRQRARKDWSGVLQRLAADLESFAGRA